MKKLVIILFLLVFAWNAQAQNVPVIPLDERVGGYYYWDSNWVDMYYGNSSTEIQTGHGPYMSSLKSCPTVGLRFFYSKAPLKIIGIAGCMTSEEIGIFNFITGEWSQSMSSGWVIDHPEERLPEYFQLYTYEGGNFSLAAQALWDTASIKYYMHVERMEPQEDSTFVVTGVSTDLPMYECYFEKEVVVKDSFYVGYTFNNNYRNATTGNQDHWGSMVYFLRTHLLGSFYGELYEWPPLLKWRFTSIDPDLYVAPDPHYPDTRWHWFHTRLDQMVVFPIFDTSYVAEVPQAVLEEYVMMRPNPATDRVQVFSSFNIRSIEVHNIAGQLVERRKVDATQTVLDVSAWEKGPYVVTITTPAGTVTRKLVVQ